MWVLLFSITQRRKPRHREVDAVFTETWFSGAEPGLEPRYSDSSPLPFRVIPKRWLRTLSFTQGQKTCHVREEKGSRGQAPVVNSLGAGRDQGSSFRVSGSKKESQE
jgi:hypothetical protein